MPPHEHEHHSHDAPPKGPLWKKVEGQDVETDIEGINPKDVSPQDLLPSETNKDALALVEAFIKEHKEAEKAQKEEEEMPLLTDSEIMKAAELLEELNGKYYHQYGHFQNLTSLRKEAEERFAKIGLIVQVDWIQSGLTGQPITITILDRVTPVDPEEFAYDVKSGVADKYWDAQRAKQKEYERQKKK